jgi:hypothetical protein
LNQGYHPNALDAKIIMHKTWLHMIKLNRPVEWGKNESQFQKKPKLKQSKLSKKTIEISNR